MRRGIETKHHSAGANLSIFTEGDLDDLHLGALEILDRTGVFVESDEALDIFSDAGCRVDRETHIVRIPPTVVADALRSVRPSFRLCGRDPKDDVLVEQGRTVFALFGEGLFVNDIETGERRESVKQDMADLIRVGDALDELEVNNAAIIPRDVPDENAEIHSLEAVFHNTTKPFAISFLGKRDCEIATKMAAAVAGGYDALIDRPLLMFVACPVAPLVLPNILTENFIAGARTNAPIQCTSMGMAGASTPVSLAGTLLVQNCEQLASIVLVQKVNPGNPMFYGSSTCTMDMRWASSAVGTPETALYMAGTAAMARYYSMPSWTAGY
jgi:trimethylamine--corrinoid protein Co-methyltransferase